MKTREQAKDVQDAVEEDFTLHYRVCNTEEFLRRLLFVPQPTLDKILHHMKDAKLYNSQTQRWAGFPNTARPKRGSKGKKTKPKEKSLYGAFCAIAEGIREFIAKERSDSSKMGATKWIDYHSKSPKSLDSNRAPLRPDVLLAFQAIAQETASTEIQQGKDEEEREREGQEEAEDEEQEEVNREAEAEADGDGDGEEGGEGEREGMEAEEADGEKENGKGKDNLQLFIGGSKILAAVEVKRKESQNWQAVVKQLFSYLRRILREQLDRRIVFGLTLGPDTITVWLHDRSGVIGTKTAINIHKEPLKFIQVIASSSLLPPERLGFDPTTEILVSPTQAVPLYKPKEDFITDEGSFIDIWLAGQIFQHTEGITCGSLGRQDDDLCEGRGTALFQESFHARE